MQPTDDRTDAAGAPVERPVRPLPTSAEDEAVVLARLSKTPAEAYERGFIDGHARAAEEIERLRAALLEARDNIAAWGDYASPYFQQKHGLDEDIERADAALRA